MVIVNRPRTPKLWTRHHENVHNERKRRFFGNDSQALYRVLCSFQIALEQPKLWLVDHENGHKAPKQRVLGHKSQTCIGSYGCCKLPKKPKTMGNSS